MTHIGLLVPVIAMLIPIVAIVGGITAGIFRMEGQRKIAELAMKERIAAIEKGLDPARLPPVPALAASGDVEPSMTPRERALRTSVKLGVGAVITFFSGLGLVALMLAIPGARDGWILGFIPVFVGLGLGAAALLVHRTAPPAAPAPAAAPPER